MKTLGKFIGNINQWLITGLLYITRGSGTGEILGILTSVPTHHIKSSSKELRVVQL